MNSLFVFRHRVTEPGAHKHTLLVFTGNRGIPPGELVEAVNDDAGHYLRPDRMVFLIRDDAYNEISTDVTKAIDSEGLRIHPKDVPTGIVTFGPAGELKRQHKISEGWINITEDDLNQLRSGGILTIFKKQGGLLLPGPGVHYVHPPERHSRAFIRAANVLIEGPEVMFLAMALLPYLANGLRFIWIDTSSIASLAYATISLRQSMDPTFENPMVGSFSSYDGIKKAPFRHLDNSLALVSATTSGNLGRELVAEYEFAPERVVNLFSLAANAKPARVLCDLSSDLELSQYSANNEFTPANCPMCRSGSKTVHFVGDQFLADSIVYDPYVIKETDAPASLHKVMELFSEKGAFQVRAERINEDPAPNSIWIEVKALMEADLLNASLDNAAHRYLPLTTALIVHTGEPASEKMANYLRDKLAKVVATPPDLINQDALKDARLPEREGAAVIITGCVASGTTLQHISRDLRNSFADRPRIYLTAFAKHNRASSFETLRSDLRFNGSHLKHEFASLFELGLPRLPRESAWTKELEVLQEISANITREEEGYPPAAREPLQARLTLLGKLSAGAHDNLFWSLPGKDPLQLRQTFAFWPSKLKGAVASQGDVFATIACVLENLRTGTEAKLRSTPFYQNVIAPSCFGRYNDGIIQASLLRAALPQELNFQSEPSLGQGMLPIIEAIIEGWETSRGEACLEFLVALCTHRLRLAPAQLAQLIGKAPRQSPPVINALIQYLSKLPPA